MGKSVSYRHSGAQVSATSLLCHTIVQSFFKHHPWELIRDESETVVGESSSSGAETSEHTAL